MDKTHFLLTTAQKTLALLFLSLLCVKAAGSLRVRSAEKTSSNWAWIRGVLYVVIAVLAMMGARGLGTDVSAGLRALASERDVRHTQFSRAYVNALRAVELRPNDPMYWRELSVAKFFLNQYESAVADEPAYRALRAEDVDQEAAMRYSYLHYALGQYSEVFPLTQAVIQYNPGYSLPYIVEGMTYTAQKKYAHAEQQYREALRYDPTLEDAVAGLAHVHYLMGDVGGALEVLDATSKLSFPPEARKHFNDLKVLYAQ